MNILIVEDDMKLPDDYLKSWAEEFSASEVKYLFNIYNADKKEIFELFNWCDILAFKTTFWYSNNILNLAKIFSSIKKPISVYIDNPETKEYLEKILDDEMAFKLKHHTFYQFEHFFRYKKESHKKIDLSLKIKSYENFLKSEQERKENEREYLKSRQTALTGRKIKIKKVQGFGKLFESLKEGMIADEIDCTKIDPNPKRGIWIWGNGEPVKLLNEGVYQEYEVVNLSIEDLIDEIFKSTQIENNKTNFFIIYGILQTEDNIEDKANNLCESLQIQKRINRQNIRNLLTKVC